MAKVFLGIGHGGSDPGAVANGFREKDLNLSIGLACNEELVRHGVITLMSRTVDENDTLQEEIRECNAFAPDLALDIHNNAGGGDGIEAYYHYKGGPSKTLAENLLAEAVAIGQNSRGAKIRLGSDGRDYYGFIRQTAAPAVIVECAFVDNITDIAILDTEGERVAMGIALAKGILKTLGIPWQPPVAADPGPEAPTEVPEIPEDPDPEIPTEVPEIPEEDPEPEAPTEVPDPETPKEDGFWKRVKELLRELIDRFFRWLDL